MQVPARILRAHLDNLPDGRAPPTAREREREDRILAVATLVMAMYGRGALTMGKLATALRMGGATLRRHFVDMDELLGEILLRHLRAIVQAIGQAPPDPAARRAAYLAATRTPEGTLTEAQLLLVRERHTLPPDLEAAVEQARQNLGELLGGTRGAVALAVLDSPALQAPQIEAMLATLAPPATAVPADAPGAPAVRVKPPPAKPAQPNWTYPRQFAPSRANQARAGPA